MLNPVMFRRELAVTLSFGLVMGAACLPSQAGQALPGSTVSGSLTLEQAVQIGLKQSPSVWAAEADARAAAAEARSAAGMKGLQISANTYLTHGDTQNIFSTSPGVMPVNSAIVRPNPFADQNLTAMLPLHTGSRLENMVRAANSRSRASAFDVNEVRSEIAYRIREAFYRALLSAEMVKAAQAKVEASQGLFETLKALADVGKGIEASVMRAQAELSGSELALRTAQNDQAKSLLDLKEAMGISLDSQISLSGKLEYAKPDRDLAAYAKAALARRPELQSRRARTEAADADIGAAKGASEPQIYGAAMADGFASNHQSSGVYSIGVTISLPVFDSGIRRADTEKAREAKRRAEAGTKEAELRIRKDVNEAWLDAQTASANVQSAQTALAAAQSAYEVIALRVQNQKSILVEQLDALAALSQSRADLAKAMYDSALAVAKLKRAAGEI